MNARNLRGCEDRCINQRNFECRAFAYSYSSRDTSFRNDRNCELSENRLRDGGNTQYSSYQGSSYGTEVELQSNRGWTVYERDQFSGQCRSGSYGGGNYNNNNNYYDNDDYYNNDSNYNNNNGNYNNNNNNNNYYGGGLQCYQRHRKGYTLDGRIVQQRRKVSSVDDCAKECDRERRGSTRGRGCNAFAFEEQSGGSSGIGFGSSYGVERDCLLSDESGSGINDQLRRDDKFEVWEYRDDGRGNCRGSLYGNRRSSSVNGRRCEGQTSFDRRDQYWYCQTNKRDWDYCCRPGSNCGYSKTYESPWCYVGDSRSDRWRPCDRNLVENDYVVRDGRAQVSRKVIHSSEPNIDRRAPEKSRASWYNRNRLDSRLRGNTDSDSFFYDQNRERGKANQVQPLATSSNPTEAVVKFGF